VTAPLFWLVLSFLFVTVSLTIVLVVLIPTLREIARAARSAERLFETLRREFPPTLEAIRLTGMEITDLTDDLSEGVQSAGNVVKQVDQTLSGARQQAQKVRINTRSIASGIRAAWNNFTQPSPPPRASLPSPPNAPGPNRAASPHRPEPAPLAQPSPEKPAAKRASTAPPEPEQIPGSHFVATPHTGIEQVGPYPLDDDAAARVPRAIEPDSRENSS
jgi:uncharacterized protein YoxC